VDKRQGLGWGGGVGSSSDPKAIMFWSFSFSLEELYPAVITEKSIQALFTWTPFL